MTIDISQNRVKRDQVVDLFPWDKVPNDPDTQLQRLLTTLPQAIFPDTYLNYILIGGQAVRLYLRTAGLDRHTSDVDIAAISPEFRVVGNSGLDVMRTQGIPGNLGQIPGFLQETSVALNFGHTKVIAIHPSLLLLQKLMPYKELSPREKDNRDAVLLLRYLQQNAAEYPYSQEIFREGLYIQSLAIQDLINIKMSYFSLNMLG